MIFIHTKCENIEDAQKLSDEIINQKIGACVDYWPVTSCYGDTQESMFCKSHVKVLITTFESKIDSVSKIISEYNKDPTPLVAGVDVRRVNHVYKEWMMEVIQ